MAIETLADLARPDAAPMLVFKIGSSLLIGKDGAPRRAWLTSLVGEIAEARQRGQQVIVVSSGAIALGAARLDLPRGGRACLADAQAAAAVGQIALSSLWAELMADFGIEAAQLLVTLYDLEDRGRYLNASATIERLLDAGAVPVINENDSVATHEIRFGDNDRLAARIAQAAQADAVVLLTDIDGLYDRDPKDSDATLLPLVEGVTEEIHNMATPGSGSGMGTGGMTSKLQAVEIAERAGIALAIVNGKKKRPFARAVKDNRGTLFLPQRNDSARKAWLGGMQRMSGQLVVDNGCADALTRDSSLLAAGITAIEGSFNRGDPVGIVDLEGNTIAQGLVEYTSDEISRILGHQTEELEDILGYAPRSAVIHRDHLVIL